PAAIVTGRSFFEAAVAIEGTAVEKLLQPYAVLLRQVAGFARQTQLVAAAVALAQVELAQQRRIVIVDTPGHHPLSIAQRTGHAKLRGDGFANKGAFVG